MEKGVEHLLLVEDRNRQSCRSVAVGLHTQPISLAVLDSASQLAWGYPPWWRWKAYELAAAVIRHCDNGVEIPPSSSVSVVLQAVSLALRLFAVPLRLAVVPLQT